MTTSSSLPSFPSTLSWSKDESAQKVKYILTRSTRLVGRSISTRSHFHLSTPSLTSLCPPICCSLSALLHEPPLHQLPSPSDTCLHQHHPLSVATQLGLCGFEKMNPLSVDQKVVLVMQHLLILMQKPVQQMMLKKSDCKNLVSSVCFIL